MTKPIRRRLLCLLAWALLAATGPVTAVHVAGHAVDARPPSTPIPGPLDVLKDLGLEGAGSGSEFLDPELAFVLTVDAAGEGTVLARWDIAQGYYLYRDRFAFAVDGSPRAALGTVELPPGKVKDDAYFGPMEVYYTRVQARVPVTMSDGGSRQLRLNVSYQGCADAGLCYPPMTKSVSLSLPPASTPERPAEPIAGDAGRAGELPEQDRLARALASGNTAWVLLAFFGLGLLLTFTPCVLPMIPILSSIIVGQGSALSTRRAFGLSLVYVLAMSATYTAAGVAAGLSGANLQAAFQNPWVLGTFSAVFVLLALSMFGVYDLQVPVRLQDKLARLTHGQKGGTYVGVGLMGLLSALIVGPCVAAPLAGALIYIARTGDAALGGAALFALSLGMGAPLLAIGTSAARLIPKSGPWMKTVKSAFGVILVGVAIYLLERLLPGWIALLLWAALFMLIAVYLVASSRRAPRARGWKWSTRGLAAGLLAYGAVLIAGAATGGDDVLRPLAGLKTGANGQFAELEFRPVKGLAQLESELRVAAAGARPVMLDFYADWCVSCKELERYTFTDEAVKAVLSEAILLRTDVTANDAEDRALLEHFGLFGPPAILFFGPDGVERPRSRVVGFMQAGAFHARASQALSPGVTPVRESRSDRPGTTSGGT